jgi:hypothetical protein
VLQGNGDGSFKPAINYPAGATPYFAEIGDFNRDGFLDVIVPNFNANTIYFTTRKWQWKPSGAFNYQGREQT